jgi:hypothetical protein
MQGHPERKWHQCSTVSAREEHRDRRHGSVQHAGCCVLWRVRLVEEAHRRQRAAAPLSDAEPEVVVDVDEDASRPESDCVSAKPRMEQRGSRCRERDVISDTHHVLRISPPRQAVV